MKSYLSTSLVALLVTGLANSLPADAQNLVPNKLTSLENQVQKPKESGLDAHHDDMKRGPLADFYELVAQYPQQKAKTSLLEKQVSNKLASKPKNESEKIDISESEVMLVAKKP